MKWYFALTEASLQRDTIYAACTEVAVLSALQHTSLAPHFLFDGGPCALTDRLQRLGTTVIFHRSSLSNSIIATNPDEPMWQQIAHGAFLRLDIPTIDIESDFILYTDCDVMFMREPDLDGIKPRFFAVAPEFTRGDYVAMNSGVMLMNLAGMRSVAAEFGAFLRAGRCDFPAFDQGALREFFAGRYDHLPEELNWKPYWGSSADAAIIHFHGPKPPQVRAMLRHTDPGYPAVIRNLFAADPANYAALDALWHAYLDRAQRL
jgi:lipopolysaccharide biosynthesis glycosyltransferase